MLHSISSSLLLFLRCPTRCRLVSCSSTQKSQSVGLSRTNRERELGLHRLPPPFRAAGCSFAHAVIPFNQFPAPFERLAAFSRILILSPPSLAANALITFEGLAALSHMLSSISGALLFVVRCSSPILAIFCFPFSSALVLARRFASLSQVSHVLQSLSRVLLLFLTAVCCSFSVVLVSSQRFAGCAVPFRTVCCFLCDAIVHYDWFAILSLPFRWSLSNSVLLVSQMMH